MVRIDVIEQISPALSIPVMAKCRFGHFVVLYAGVDIALEANRQDEQPAVRGPPSPRPDIVG